MEKILHDELLTLRTCLRIMGVKEEDVDGMIKKKLAGPDSNSIKLNDNGRVRVLGLFNGKLTGTIPSELGNLRELTYLNLSDNQLSGPIPSELGNLSKLTELYLFYNQLSGPIPSELGNLRELTYLSLSGNQLSGPIPSELGTLSELKTVYVVNNANLSGVSVFSSDVHFYNDGTSMSSMSVKPKQLHDFGTIEGTIDDIGNFLHVAIGYIDLGTDVSAIIDLFQTNRLPIAVANIFFIVLEVCLGIKNSEGKPMDYFLNITQLSILVNGYLTWRDRMQTIELLASKKVDAICRSVPSVILQLYSLLIALDEYPAGSKSYQTLVVSVAFGLFGPAWTLAGAHRKTGSTFLSVQFLIVNVYYYGELLLRVLTVGIAFISVREYAFIAVGIDCGLRLLFVNVIDDVKFDISNYVLYLGSDYALSNNYAWWLGSSLTFIEAVVFITVMFTLENDSLHSIRARGTALHITLFMIAALIIKTGLYVYIENYMQEAVSKKVERTTITWKERADLRRQKQEIILNKMHEKQTSEGNDSAV